MKIKPQALEAFSFAVLRSFGCNKEEASIVSNHLVDANLAGHDSHGVGMLPMYGLQVRDGNLVPNQTPEYLPANGAVTVVDARKGFGHHMALLALDAAMKTIPEHNVALLGLRNAGHISRVGTYSEYCASKGYASIHMVNVVGHHPIVAPHGAREGGFSTNPISMAIPQAGEAKPMLDMATSTVAFGKVRVAHNKGEQMPLGNIVDGDGLPTSDPAPMVENKIGALSAFGDHKGSGLGIFAEIMAGALAGTNTIDSAENFPNGVLNNMFSVIIDPAGFDDPEKIAARTAGFSDFVKNLQPAKGTHEVLLPGEPEAISREHRNANGVPVDEETIRQIIEIGRCFDAEPDELSAILHDA